MRMFDLARKDWLQIFREKRSLIFIIIMPIAFTYFFGFTMGASNNQEQDRRLPVAVWNLDGESATAQGLINLLNASETVRPVTVDSLDEAGEKTRAGEWAGAVYIPAGWGEGLLAGQPENLDVTLDRRSQAGITAERALQASLARLVGAAHMARFNAQAFETQAGFEKESEKQAFIEESFRQAVKQWMDPAVTVRMAAPVVEDGPGKAANPYTQFSPGMMVMFAVFSLSQVAMTLVFERRSGALRRLISTPIRRWELIGGHVLAMFGVVFGQQVLLAGFGQLALKVDYLREPLATILILAALSLMIAALGLLIGSLAKVEQQVTLWSLIVMFVMSALGGTWFPLEVSGEAFAAAGHLMPTAWAMDGLQNIVLRGLGFESALLPVGVLTAYALVFFGIAVMKFRID